jgi:hypothetical protein
MNLDATVEALDVVTFFEVFSVAVNIISVSRFSSGSSGGISEEHPMRANRHAISNDFFMINKV